MVTLHMDYARVLEPAPADILVEKVEDYIPAYARMAEAIHADQPLTIIVRNSACAAWLRTAQGKYGPERICITEITRRSQLAELWGVELPNWVTDEAIARAGLLGVRLRAQPGQRFENVVLEAFYSPFLTYDRLPLSYVPELLNSYDPDRWTKSNQRPLAREVLSRQLQAWQDTATSEGERLLVEGLRRDPTILTHKLAQVKVLTGYPPEVGRRVLGPEYDAFANLHLDLTGLRIREASLGTAVDQIRVWLNTLGQPELPDKALETMLQQVSGYLLAEFEALELLLKSGSVRVDEDTIRRVRLKFAPIHDRLEQKLADLDLLVTPPRPPAPNPDGTWTANEWLDWVEQHYLRYRFWLEEIGRYDEETAAQADAYAEWLYSHYQELRLSYPRIVYRALLAVRDRLVGTAPVLVAVIDNLNYKFYPDLRRYLEGLGFFLQQSTPYLSMLPSCTEISKRCIFIGQPEPFSGAFGKPVQEAWGASLGGRRVKYLPDIGALRSVKQREHDVYMLNYLPVDSTLHGDERETGVPYSAAVRQLLRALADDIRAFSERIGAERDLVVIVVSDHGSTRISAEAPNPIDQQFYAGRVQNRHNRYVTIGDSELGDLPGNVRFECYIFDRKRFDLPTNYLAARSTYRFTEPGAGIYVHGGLWPEETVIPLAVFTPTLVTPQPLTVRLLADEFRFDVKSTIRLELVNTNQHSCLQVSATVLTPRVQAEAVLLGELEPLSQAEMQIEARIGRGEDLHVLHIRVSYQFVGRPYTQDVELPIRMKRIMTTTVDLSEL